MATPLSLKSNFFNVGDVAGDNVLGGFCHKKLETIKVKAASKNANWNYKLSSTYSDKAGIKYSDELKVGGPHKDMYVQSQIDRKDQVKCHLDLGQFTVASVCEKPFNLHVALKTNAFMSSFWWRFGQSYKHKNVECHSRVELDKEQNKCVSLRTNLSHKSAELAAALIYRVNDNTLRKYDANLTYSVNDSLKVGLKHNTPVQFNSEQMLSMGKVMLGAVYKVDKKNTLALKLYKNNANDKTRAQIGLDSQQCSHFSVKAKVDDKGKTTAMLKTKINDRMSLSLAAQFNFQNGAKFVNFENTLPLPIGYQVDLAL